MNKLALKVSFLLLLVIGSFSSYSQHLRSSQDSLVFQNTFVRDRDSIQLNLQNVSYFTLQVSNVKFYSKYGNFVFSASQTSFSMQPQSSHQITIAFEPEHNILYNSELVIQYTGNNGFIGAKSIDLKGQGVFSNPYYNSTQNLEEQALKNALKTRTGQGYNDRGYNGARDFMYGSIDNSGGQVECVYTGRRATFNTRAGANSNSFNCEHTFPQGFFNSISPMKSDIHHLFPTDVNANSRRGNLPFGIVSGNGVWNQGGSKQGTNTFEPRNQQKGRTARAMMYFVIRYQDYSNHFAPQENLLIGWHNTYPPDSVEEKRNNDIFAVQNNRNPFVDYPQFAERITNFVSNSTAVPVNGIDITRTSIDFGSFLSQQPDTNEFIIVNRGNTTVTFSNFSLSNTSILSFAGGFGGSIQILPGDALVVPVVAQTNTTITINETLGFNTSLPGGLSSLTIPVRGGTFVVGLDEEVKEQLKIYPNPAEDQLTVEGMVNGQKQLRILDQNGRLVKELSTSQVKLSIDVNEFPKGVYVLEVVGEKDRQELKFSK